MQRYQKWIVTLGIMAVAPSITMAELPSFLKFGKSTHRPTSQRQVVGTPSNQQAAEKIAAALRDAKLRGFDIGIEVQDGVATLTGKIADASHKAKATQIASKVRGVRRVNNKLTLLAASRLPAETVAKSAADKKPVRSPIQPVGHEDGGQAASEGVQVASFEPTGSEPGIEQAHFTPENSESGVKPVGYQAPDANASANAERIAKAGNQIMAERVAKALSRAKLQGYDIEIRYDNGTAMLGGSVTAPQQVAMATQVVSNIPGVRQVDNQLTVAPPADAVQSYPPMPVPVMPVNYQGGPGPQPSVGPGPGGMSAPPSYGHPGRQGSHVAYNMPNLPEHAWPSYASYPNYAQVSYPKEYSASAWPYIGPFYPYPQVPLGWRQAQLEWDDGHWSLNFRPRTDKWFWFLHPKNW